MSKQADSPVGPRCPTCDTVIPPGATRCLMCGTLLEEPTPAAPSASTPEADAPQPQTSLPDAETQPAEVADPPAAAAAAEGDRPPYKPMTVFVAAEEPDDRPRAETLPEVVTSTLRERPSPAAITLTAVMLLFTCIIGLLILRFQGDNTLIVMAPTPTPPTPTATMTPTPSPLPEETTPPTFTPTITQTPPPTATLPPPRSHTVAGGETLIGISFLYRVSVESIAALNEISSETAVQVNQNLLIPWPTPTPPLETIAVEVNGELVIADPEGCDRYEVQSGDSIVGIANRFGIQFDILAEVNRITNPDLLRPGDTLCIPEIRYGESLPPTPGPTPTATVTRPPAGPALLYPVQNAVIDDPDQTVTLQWVAVKDLTDSEYYMVELSDRRAADAIIWRGFTRDTAFQLPERWRPAQPAQREMVWRVRIVNVTGWRADGLPIYTYGGESSAEGYFSWRGEE